MQRLKSFVTHRGMRALPAMLTILLLAPAPVLAFSWVSSWQVDASLAVNGAPSPKFTSKDGANTQADPSKLNIDMGTVFVAGSEAAGVLEMSRQLKITNGADFEKVRTTASYSTVLEHAKFRVRVWFTPVLNGPSPQAFNFSRQGRTNDKINFTGNVTAIRKLPSGAQNGVNQNQGNYLVHVRVGYQTFATGGREAGWSNAGPVSAHTFTFAGGF